MIEEWKVIEDYELYMVSNLGRVKRITHSIEIFRPDLNCFYLANRKEKYLKLCENYDGYVCVKLYKIDDRKFGNHHLVHRLVAKAFILNPENKYSVNHLDGIKTNNRIDNLEWATQKEQTDHAADNNLMAEKVRSKAVDMYSLDGVYLRSFKSTNEASIFTGYTQARVSECCIGKRRKYYKKHIFRFSNNPL